jgi:hypothetical protein
LQIFAQITKDIARAYPITVLLVELMTFNPLRSITMKTANKMSKISRQIARDTNMLEDDSLSPADRFTVLSRVMDNSAKLLATATLTGESSHIADTCEVGPLAPVNGFKATRLANRLMYTK